MPVTVCAQTPDPTRHKFYFVKERKKRKKKNKDRSDKACLSDFLKQRHSTVEKHNLVCPPDHRVNTATWKRRDKAAKSGHKTDKHASKIK